jgi:hypothetical protein
MPRAWRSVPAVDEFPATGPRTRDGFSAVAEIAGAYRTQILDRWDVRPDEDVLIR